MYYVELKELQNEQFSSERYRVFTLFRRKNYDGEKNSASKSLVVLQN